MTNFIVYNLLFVLRALICLYDCACGTPQVRVEYYADRARDPGGVIFHVPHGAGLLAGWPASSPRHLLYVCTMPPCSLTGRSVISSDFWYVRTVYFRPRSPTAGAFIQFCSHFLVSRHSGLCIHHVNLPVVVPVVVQNILRPNIHVGR